MKKVLPHSLSLNHCYNLKLTRRFNSLKLYQYFIIANPEKDEKPALIFLSFISTPSFLKEECNAMYDYPMLAWISHILYLVEVFLAVILEVFWIDVYLVLIHSVRSRIFRWFLHKFLNFHCRLMLLYIIKWLDWNKGWGYTVFKRKEKRAITYCVCFYSLTTKNK